MSTGALTDAGFRSPGRSAGLLEVVRKPYLTSLIVHKELRARYRGSIFGMLWSYAKPLTQFLVFYFAVGVFMRMNDSVEHYVIYMFAGIIIMNYFSEVFGNATRSVVGNAALVKKIYLPRELFPVSSMLVALVHFLPQVLVLLAGALYMGWQSSVLGIAAILLGFFIVTCTSLGVGLLTGALNVFYRDSENFVDLLLMMATWLSPVLYTWMMVYDAVGHVWNGALWYLFQLNPLTIAVELFHFGFWEATLGGLQGQSLPPHIKMWTLVALGVSCGLLVVGELVFRRLDSRFAQEL